MKTEERKAKIGERILITNAYMNRGYKNGDILTVKESVPEDMYLVGHVYAEGIECRILDREYKVIVDENEMEADNVGIIEKLQAELFQTKDELEALKKRVDELETKQRVRKSFVEYREMKTQKRHEKLKRRSQEKKQRKRDEIIEKAKQDINNLREKDGFYNVVATGKSYRYACNVEFIVDREKRMVTALLRGRDSNKIYAYGVAQCHPDDCFNIHLGKIIALYKALGLKIPYEYYNAPQPTKVKGGDIIQLKNGSTRKVLSVDEKCMYYGNGKFNSLKLINDGRAKIIDDSRE
ncbi:hypothetical protein [Bacillus smithii]|uniref:hypothetical protein n=1 Tax=Bacillus smithii TaxID=1479 RepID=UPI002E1CAA0E|nr:hypothetical protein [Bacillus smithii]MED4929154.1 hypothetical protein [Bacillus smithii]